MNSSLLGDGQCEWWMSASDDKSRCTGTAEFVVRIEYVDEPDITLVCSYHLTSAIPDDGPSTVERLVQL